MNAPSLPQPGESIHYVPLKILPTIDLFHSEDESTIFALGKLLLENHIDSHISEEENFLFLAFLTLYLSFCAYFQLS